MRIFVLSLLVLQFAALPLYAAGTVVKTVAEDWTNPAGSGWTLSGWSTKAYETTAPATSSHTFVNVAGANGLTGQWLYAQENSGTAFTATTTLTGVPAFDNVSIEKLILGAGGGIDANHFDGLSISINGTQIFNADLHGRNSGDANWTNSYGGKAPGTILSGVATSDTNGAEFFNDRTDGWGHDTLYDAGLDPQNKDIPLTGAGNVTIAISGRLTNGTGGAESHPDEQLGVGNMRLAFAVVPEPSSVMLLISSGLGFMMLRRRGR